MGYLSFGLSLFDRRDIASCPPCAASCPNDTISGFLLREGFDTRSFETDDRFSASGSGCVNSDLEIVEADR